MTRIKGRCTKNHEPLVAKLTREIQARRLARLGDEADAAIVRYFNGTATLGDLATFKRALAAAESIGVQAS